jgi:septal ring factor EnvC (AmiA/AmiB activator)|tara:strand:- start:734 stop:865 length:132 start_codon:yes stop_codon:yes gene_type:complete
MARQVKKIIKGLEKASKTHKQQAQTLKKHVASMKKPKAKARRK